MPAGSLTGAPKATTEQVLGRTRHLSRVPAPTGQEAKRAATASEWWREDGLQEVEIDEAGNVWGLVRSGTDGAIVVAAHLDTVFDEETTHETYIEEDRMFGPGVGDNTVAVAALASLDSLLPSRTHHPVWILGTTGEEGLGNLSGITHALREPRQHVEALIAVEGNYLGRIATRGVGSVRFAVRIQGPGGHAWEDKDAPNAVQVAAEFIAEVADLRSSDDRSTSVNVGRICGGEAINVRAPSAGFDVDLRADNSSRLSELEERFIAIVNTPRPEIETSLRLLGRRPAGHIAPDHPLVVEASSVLHDIGFTPEKIAASTDANAAYDHGIPAIAVGVTTGGGEHTPNEWIDLKPLPLGLAALAETITRFDRHVHS